MTPSELNEAIKNDKVEVVKPETAQADEVEQENLGQPILADFLPILATLRSPKAHLTAAPDFVPKNLLEQIQFVDDGSSQDAYFYFNKSWQRAMLNLILPEAQSDHLSISIPHGTSTDTIGTTSLDFNPVLIIGILHNQGSATPSYMGFWTPIYESTSIPCGNRADSATSFLGPDSSFYLHDLSFSSGTLTYHYKNTSVSTDGVAELLIVGS